MTTYFWQNFWKKNIFTFLKFSWPLRPNPLMLGQVNSDETLVTEQFKSYRLPFPADSYLCIVVSEIMAQFRRNGHFAKFGIWWPPLASILTLANKWTKRFPMYFTPPPHHTHTLGGQKRPCKLASKYKVTRHVRNTLTKDGGSPLSFGPPRPP